ncbi:outer membrane export usher protein [Escherichia coli]|uniref:Outer membrane export usher protein n=1 Tax=Escherichia coli TaxID=562 RepID=A0A377BTZ3_ECOLX|nr:outer membrane export usher protein [Escherichia coli]
MMVSLAQVDLSANYHEGQYTSAGLSLQGGATLTAHGGALHRTQNMGGTRLLIDADGVADVPVEGNGAAVYTNMFGKGRRFESITITAIRRISTSTNCRKTPKQPSRWYKPR